MVRLHKPCTYLTSTLTPSPNGPNEIPHDPRHLGVPLTATKTSFQLSFVNSEYHRVPRKRYLSLWYIWRIPYPFVALTLTPSPNGPNEIPHDPRHLGDPSGSSKMVPEPMLRSAQTVHRSCVKNSTISKRTKTRFYLSFVT